MDEIIAIVGKVLAAAVVALFAYLVPKIKTWLEAKIGSEGTAKVLLLIENFVTAADQLYKAGNSKVKNRGDRPYQWWERSPHSSKSTIFCIVSGFDTASYTNANNGSGVAFGFCV